jgi:peptide/nickel transport system substrate-binding protein
MRDRLIRMARTMAVAAAVSVVAASCGGGTSPSTASEGRAGELDRAAVLRVTGAGSTRNLDPYLQTSSGGRSYLTPIFDRLTVVDGSGLLQPKLAESWQFAPDGSYLELKLRKDVTFHDGARFDAAVVAANIERGRTMEGSAVVTALQDITGVENVDDYTAHLNLAPGTGVELPGVFSTNVGMMVSPKAIESGTDLRNDPGPSGSGAYVVSAYAPDKAGDLQAMVSNSFSPKVDPAETVNYFLTGPYGLANDNLRITKLAEVAANPALSEQERVPLYNQIGDLTLQETMFVPICSQTNATASTSKSLGPRTYLGWAWNFRPATCGNDQIIRIPDTLARG